MAVPWRKSHVCVTQASLTEYGLNLPSRCSTDYVLLQEPGYRSHGSGAQRHFGCRTEVASSFPCVWLKLELTPIEVDNGLGAPETEERRGKNANDVFGRHKFVV
jgi:hypothetical protein